MDGGQVWPSEPESGTDYAGARGGRFRKFLKGSVGKLRVLPAGTRSGVGTRHGPRGPPPPGRGAMSARGMGCGEPPNPEPRGAPAGCKAMSAWGTSCGEPPPRAAERHCHEARAAGSTPRTWGDVGTGHGLRGAPPGHGEPPQDAKRRQHGARAAGSPAPRMRSGVGKRARPGLGADARHRHRRRLSEDPRATASSAPKT